MGTFSRRPAEAPSRLIGEAEFAAQYAAAEFAAAMGLPCDTSVTLTWELLGRVTDQEILDAFTKFLKCYRDFCRQRRLLAVYLYAHENSPKRGVHTHFAVYMPVERRKEFSAWVRFWVRGFIERHAVPKAPGAVHVSLRPREDMLVHWLLFSYQMKGYDGSAVVQSRRTAPNGRAVMLGDLIAYGWEDPGPISLKHRCGHSDTIWPGRRAVGHPVCDPVDHRAFLRTLDVARVDLNAGHASVGGRRGGGEIEPFRSSYEDGIRDVRRLYPTELYRWVTQLSDAVPPVAESDPPLTVAEIMKTLQI